MHFMARHTALVSLILASSALVALDSAAQALLQTIERDPPANHHRFGGGDIDMNGDELLIGCPWDRLIGGPSAGVVYRFQRDGDRFVQTGTIGDTTTCEQESFFGTNIIIEGDRMVISAHGWNSQGGRAFVFERIDGTWEKVATLTPSMHRVREYAGFDTDARGPFVALGAPNPQFGSNEHWGRVVIFEETLAGWNETQVLQPNAGIGDRDFFGWSLTFVENDMLAVGAPQLDDVGQVFLYRLLENSWVLEQVLQDTSGFGISLAAKDGVLFVGHTADSELAFRAGAVYAFAHDGNEWVQLDKLLPSDPREEGRLGEEISCQGDVILVGARGEPGHGNYGQGKAYVFERTGPAEWVERTSFEGPAPQPLNGDLFAYRALLTGNLAICSANCQLEENGEGSFRGAVYVFDLERMQAPLSDFTIAFGTLESGELDWLRRSGNAAVIARSQFGFAANEPNLVDLRIGAASPLPSPAAIDLSIEGHLSQIGGTCRVRLRNWSTGQFQQVHQYPIGSTETIEDIEGIDAANRVRAADGRIELSLRQSVMATFSATGFQSFNDWIGVAVRE